MKLTEPDLRWFRNADRPWQWQTLEFILVAALLLLLAIWAEPHALAYRYSLINHGGL